MFEPDVLSFFSIFVLILPLLPDMKQLKRWLNCLNNVHLTITIFFRNWCKDAESWGIGKRAMRPERRPGKVSIQSVCVWPCSADCVQRKCVFIHAVSYELFISCRRQWQCSCSPHLILTCLLRAVLDILSSAVVELCGVETFSGFRNYPCWRAYGRRHTVVSKLKGVQELKVFPRSPIFVNSKYM